MPSKKSKPTRKAQRPSRKASPRARPSRPASAQRPERPAPSSAWKDAPGCSENELAAIARSLAGELKAGDRVLLEGPLGAGKTTFSRYLLLALDVEQPPEGSPTFAIAHEYALPASAKKSGAQGVVHVDLYRIRSEEEIDERGIPDYFWDDRKIVLCEWASMWPDFERQLLNSGRNWRVALSIPHESSQQANRRDLRITRPERRSSKR